MDAEAGKLDPFVLILEGSLPNEKLSGDGYFAAMGDNPDTGQPITTNEWIDRLAPKAAAVVAVGTCATYGGIPAMKNNPTGAMGLSDYLGWKWKSKAGIPIVNIPGCPAQPDNITETLMYLVFALAGMAPVPELDDVGRPKWLFERTAHESCNRAAFYESGNFATEYGSDHRCLVKLGCKGPVVKCNVPLRGWVNGIGGCPNVGGICMACTMPGFPDKYMPFMEPDPRGRISSDFGEVHLRARPALGAQPEHQAQVRQGAGVASQPGRAHHRLPEALVEERGASHVDSRDDSRARQEGRRQADVVGPDHPHRRVARDPRGHRLREPQGREVLLDLDDLPRLRHLHEGHRPAGHALPDQPHLRHLR